MAAQNAVNVADAGSCCDYCDCAVGCEPLIDTTTGCVCPGDDPFNRTGELCACGGARYLGCVDRGTCADTEIHCEAGCLGGVGTDGCPTCLCSSPGGP